MMVNILQTLLGNEYDILLFVCLGWRELKSRYCLLSVDLSYMSVSIHYENMLIQICRKFHLQKLKIFG